MSDYKIVYLIVEHGTEVNRQTFWRVAGTAYVCRDGSLNLKLDMHPGLRFNIRDPKSNGEREDIHKDMGKDIGEPMPEISPHARAIPRKPPKEVIKQYDSDDDIPF